MKHLRKNPEAETEDDQVSRSTMPDAQREGALNFQCSSQICNLDRENPCSDTNSTSGS